MSVGRFRKWGAMGLLTLLATAVFMSLSSCSLLNPFSNGPSLPSVPKLPGTGGGGASGALATTETTLAQIGNFAWLSVILVLFFPKMREPLVNLWTAILGALSIPFMAAKSWADKRFQPQPKKRPSKPKRKRAPKR